MRIVQIGIVYRSKGGSTIFHMTSNSPRCCMKKLNVKNEVYNPLPIISLVILFHLIHLRLHFILLMNFFSLNGLVLKNHAVSWQHYVPFHEVF
jgi:hypothetical protein